MLMAKMDRIFDLLHILQANKYATTAHELRARLDGCSESTLKRYIRTIRDEWNLPLQYDRKYEGYLLDKTDDMYAVPGLWFSAAELHSWLFIHELIDRLGPGLLKTELRPFRNRIEKMLSLQGIATRELGKRFAFLGTGIRICCPETFRLAATAVMERKRLQLRYHSRGDDTISLRQVSPQRLIHYRGNWYLAVWCHTRNAPRALALERMSEVVSLDEGCIELAEEELRDWFTASFGIFTGRPEQEAVLVFSRESARWVAEEQWHPGQKGRLLPSGEYELRLPYADQRELVMEILRFGPEVRVEAPPELQNAVCERLALALRRYKKNESEKK